MTVLASAQSGKCQQRQNFPRFLRQQLGPFDQPAEFLLRGFVVRAFIRVNVGHSLILHFESFELDNSQEDFSLLPDLALLEPH